MCAPLVALGVWLLLATGCATLPPPRKAPAELRVVATPETAIVYLNDRYLASARALAVQPIKLRPGKKLVTIKAPGHFPHDLALDLPSGETTVKIELRPVPR